MHLARTDRSFPFSRVAQGSVVTIGAFDGLHLGHQRLLNRVLEEAAARDLPAVIMSFEPTPKEYFSAKNPPARLTRFREKFEVLERMGFDIFYCPNFNAAMRNIAADAFIRKLLVHALNMQHLVIGDDFRFAKMREGDVAQLQRAGRALNFSVEQVSSVIVQGERISSTSIRDALRDGDMTRVRRLLGSYYRMSGRVMRKNEKNSEKQTLFITLQRRRSAVGGVFAVKVGGIHGKPLDAVACIGDYQTEKGRRSNFALHIPGLDQAVSGAHVNVDFIAQLSGEANYDSVDQVIEQLHRYKAAASRILTEQKK